MGYRDIVPICYKHKPVRERWGDEIQWRCFRCGVKVLPPGCGILVMVLVLLIVVALVVG